MCVTQTERRRLVVRTHYYYMFVHTHTCISRIYVDKTNIYLLLFVCMCASLTHSFTKVVCAIRLPIVIVHVQSLGTQSSYIQVKRNNCRSMVMGCFIYKSPACVLFCSEQTTVLLLLLLVTHRSGPHYNKILPLYEIKYIQR